MEQIFPIDEESLTEKKDPADELDLPEELIDEWQGEENEEHAFSLT